MFIQVWLFEKKRNPSLFPKENINIEDFKVCKKYFLYFGASFLKFESMAKVIYIRVR
jgi:hypothetical protein